MVRYLDRTARISSVLRRAKQRLEPNGLERELLRVAPGTALDRSGERVQKRPEVPALECGVRRLSPRLDHVGQGPVRNEAALVRLEHQRFGVHVRERKDLHAIDPLRLGVSELAERVHGQCDGLAESRTAVERVLTGDQEFRSERQIVANEDAAPGAEAQGERLVDRVPDADGKGDALGDGRKEVESPEEPGIVLRKRELHTLDLEVSGLQGTEDRVEHMIVPHRKPCLGVCGRFDRVEFLSGHDARTAMEAEAGFCHGLLLCYGITGDVNDQVQEPQRLLHSPK